MATQLTSTEINDLEESVREIKNLRESNRFMAARLDVFDTMVAIFNTEPNRRDRGCSPDVVYKIEQMIEEAKTELLPTHSGDGA